MSTLKIALLSMILTVAHVFPGDRHAMSGSLQGPLSETDRRSRSGRLRFESCVPSGYLTFEAGATAALYHTCVCMCMCYSTSIMCIGIHVYRIYTYMQRERERERYIDIDR